MPFEPADAPFFFGRERERRLIAANLMASRLTLLYGETGVGKSSVLRAGVEHDLRAVAARELARGVLPEWIPVVFASWRDDPLPALREAVAASVAAIFGGAAPEPPEPAPLDAYLAAWIDRLQAVATDDDRRVRLLLVLDQFEEYFLYHGDEDGEGTVAVELPRAITREALRANFVVSIREDAYAQLDRFKGRIPNLFESYLRIRRLARNQARRAVVEPVAVYNRMLPPHEAPYEIEAGLVEAVLDEVRADAIVLGQSGTGSARDTSEDRIEAPFLQLVMRRLWLDARASRQRTLTLARLRELGGAEQIVRTHLREAMSSLDAGERDVAAEVFRHLVTPSGTKIAHTVDDLADYADVAAADLLPMLEKLAAARILRPVDPPPGETSRRFEVFHDVLTRAVLDWRTTYVHERDAVARRRVDRRRLLTRVAVVGSAVVVAAAVAAAVLAGWALRQRSDARAAANRATSLTLAARSTTQRARRLDVALLLALDGYRASPTPAAESAMVGALVAARRTGATAILHARGPVTSVAFSPVTDVVASAGGSIGLWDVRKATAVELPQRTRRADVVTFSGDGRMLAAGRDDGTVQLWDVDRRRPLGVLLASPAAVAAAAFSHDGAVLATAADDGTVWLWDVRRHRLLRQLPTGRAGRVLALAFAPDGRHLAAGEAGGFVRVWDVQRMRLTALLRGHTGSVLAVSFGDDGVVESAAADGTVRVWHLTAASPARVVRLGGVASTAAFGGDGRFVAAADRAGTVSVWDVATGRRRAVRSGNSGRPTSVGVSVDGRTVVLGQRTGGILLWDVRRPRSLGTPIVRPAPALVIATDTAVAVAPPPVDPGPVTALTFSDDGRTLASGASDGTVGAWTAAAHARRLLLDRSAPSRSIALSADGRTVASGGSRLTEDGSHASIDAWSVTSNRHLARFPRDVRGEAVLAVAFRRGGDTLASASDNGTIRLWNVARRQAHARARHVGPRFATSAAFTHDARTVAFGGVDRLVRVWDVEHEKALPSWRLPASPRPSVAAVAFSPAGDVVAAADGAGTVEVRDVASGSRVGPPLRAERRGTVLAIAVARGGLLVATTGDTGFVRLWDVRTGTELGPPLPSHEARPAAIAFTPDGRGFATAGDAAAIRLWNGLLWRDADDLRRLVCGLVVGDLSPPEWAQYAAGLPYRHSCA